MYKHIELLYLNIVSCNIVPIRSFHRYEIRIDKYKDYYSFSILGFTRLFQNNFFFSIYKKYFTRKDSVEKWIDQDIVYIYENKEKAYLIDYNYLKQLWKEAEDINNLEKEENSDKEYLIVNAVGFFEKLKSYSKTTKDLTEIRKDVYRMIKDSTSLNTSLKLPDSIKEILKED